MPIKLIVEHRQPELVKQLRLDLENSHAQLEKLKHDYSTLERKFGWETQLNNELIDLCKEYNVPYRDLLDYKRHPF